MQYVRFSFLGIDIKTISQLVQEKFHKLNLLLILGIKIPDNNYNTQQEKSQILEIESTKKEGANQ